MERLKKIMVDRKYIANLFAAFVKNIKKVLLFEVYLSVVVSGECF